MPGAYDARTSISFRWGETWDLDASDHPRAASEFLGRERIIATNNTRVTERLRVFNELTSVQRPEQLVQSTVDKSTEDCRPHQQPLLAEPTKTNALRGADCCSEQPGGRRVGRWRGGGGQMQVLPSPWTSNLSATPTADGMTASQPVRGHFNPPAHQPVRFFQAEVCTLAAQRSASDLARLKQQVMASGPSDSR